MIYRILILAGVLALYSCSSTKRLKNGETLLKKNSVVVDNPAKEVSVSDLESLIQQKPNSKFLGLFPVKLWFNSLSPKLGEPPVVFDPGLVDETKKKFQTFLDNIGFYDSDVNSKIRNPRKKITRVSYTVHLSEPYRIHSIQYEIPDDSVKAVVMGHLKNRMFGPGDVFNSFTLDNERSRLSKVLNDNGFYGFTKDYIIYKADSTLPGKNLDLTVVIRNVVKMATLPDKEPVYDDHPIYYIKNIYIQPDYGPLQKEKSEFDTLVEKDIKRNNSDTTVYRLVYHAPLKIRPAILSRSLFVDDGKKYNRTDAAQTYKKLNDLRIYKYVDVSFRTIDYKNPENPSRKYLDCTVNLTRNPVNSYSIEAQGTNSGGDLGMAGYLTYQNRNLFRGAEVLNIRVKGAMEAQKGNTSIEAPSSKFLFFNTFEAGIDGTLNIPKFLAPINENLFSRYFRPKTTMNLGYNLQDRIEYRRIITNVSFGYEWAETAFKKHILYPADINLVKVNTTPAFEDFISNESKRFQNQYTDHLIMGLRYNFVFNNQELIKIKNFEYFRGNVELAGNLLDQAVRMAGEQKNQDGYRTLFGIRYSQYVKTDIDFRYYIVIDKKNSVALRTFGGIAIPYGNSIDIPFEKGFFGGGANGMRAWPLRYLGPGAYINPNPNQKIERVGDIMLEGNAEYRFAIYKIFKGALFYDVGNIWLLRDNETFPAGKFYLDKFVNQLAMDVGFGLRLDFSYFIFRIDMAQRLRDPAYQSADRWVIGRRSNWFKIWWNLGIGYPF